MNHFSNKIGVYVRVVNNDLESALRKFKKKVEASEILDLYKEKQVYEKPSVKRHRAKQKAKFKQENNNG